MAAVDRSSPMPVYFQIALDVRRRIAAGEWTAGERIAPELQLVREYEVSRVTIRQALAELVKDDLLERHRGSGTYVREQQHPFVYDLNLTVGVMATRLREAGLDNRADVIETGVLDAPPHELRLRLQVPAGGRVIYLVRRILINEEPTAVYRSWFDADRVPGLEHAEGLDGSLSAVLTEQYGLVPARGDNSLEVVRFTREDAELLNSTTHDVPLLVVSGTTYLPDGAPLEYSQMMWLGDRVRFHFTSQTPDAGSSAPARARRARSRPSPSTPTASG
jgi:DNA-binding GntR family transcriptional regulator